MVIHIRKTKQQISNLFPILNMLKSGLLKNQILFLYHLGAIEGYYPELHDKIVVIPQGFRLENIELKLIHIIASQLLLMQVFFIKVSVTQHYF